MDEFLRHIFAPDLNAERWKLKRRDFLKGLFIAFTSAPVTMVLQSLDKASFVFDWTTIWHVGVAAGASYLIKNIFTSAK